MIYYNEFDPFAAAWLGQLMNAGLIPQGDIDTRSITEVKPDDIRQYTQCHFFAGIGGWSEALRLAGWPIDRHVWTGSCPCQPFSSAGKQKGKTDERHLWPVWFNLIRECRPATIFGEQVSSAIAHGWLDDVYQGLETEGYACGSAVLPACGVGAPHKRDRLFFVGHAKHDGSYGGQVIGSDGKAVSNNTQGENSPGEFEGAGQSCDVANTSDNGCDQGRECVSPSGMYGPNGNSGALAASEMSEQQGFLAIESRQQDGFTNSGAEFWQGEWLECPDGKQRLVEPGICLLANGVQNRVGKLRGYGNAIVAQVAAEFIAAFDDVRRGWR